MTRWCVFGGARSGHDQRFRRSAESLGRVIAARGDVLVYGGGRTGMMGHLADAAIASGAHVVGIIPGFLDYADVVHDALGEKIVVGDLFERKARMMANADAFIAMPGGLGTLDELLEVITWRQLRQLHCPVGVLDVEAFFEPLFTVFLELAEAGYAHAADIRRIHRIGDPVELLRVLSDEIADDENA